MSDAKFPPPSHWAPGARLFRNELIPTGKLRFEDVRGPMGYGMGAAVGDYDNDGDLDLYGANFGTTSSTEITKGAFTDVTAEAG